MPQLILTLVLVAVGWFLIIRPQQARQREHRAMLESLAVGDEVITAGGIHGEIISIDEDTMQLRVAPGVELTLARLAIGRRMEPGSATPATPADAEDAVNSEPDHDGTDGEDRR